MHFTLLSDGEPEARMAQSFAAHGAMVHSRGATGQQVTTRLNPPSRNEPSEPKTATTT